MEALRARLVSAEQLAPAGGVDRDTLFGLDWPEVAVADAAVPLGEVLPVVGDVTETLAALRTWLEQDTGEGDPLVVLTRLAVAVDESEAPDLTAAPVWGLVRSAQSENPGRIVLVDTDGTDASEAALAAAVAGGDRNWPCARAGHASRAWSGWLSPTSKPGPGTRRARS